MTGTLAFVFVGLALLCIVAGAVAVTRTRRAAREDGGDDDEATYAEEAAAVAAAQAAAVAADADSDGASAPDEWDDGLGGERGGSPRA